MTLSPERLDDGYQLRRRVATVLVCVMLGSGALAGYFVLTPGSSDVNITTAARGTEAATPAVGEDTEDAEDGPAPPRPGASPSTATTAPGSTTVTTATTAPPSSVTTSSSTTTSTLVCRDSHDSRCGTFVWDPPPENQPLDVKVTTVTAAPRAGDPVEFRVVVTDPDKAIDRHCFTVSNGDGAASQCTQPPPPCPYIPAKHGPWSPPPKYPDRYETTFTHVYSAPGTYAVEFRFSSVLGCYEDPYHSSGAGTATVTVGARPEGSGVTGTVTAGPTCPVEREDEPCPPRPVETELRLVRPDGSVAVRGRSGPDGRFRIQAPAGRYVLESDWPRAGGCPPVDVIVEPGRFTHADVDCDTGIR